MRCLFVAVGLNALFIVLPHWNVINPHTNPPSHIILTPGRPLMFRGPFSYHASRYIDNTDWMENPSRCIHRGRPFADPGSRGRRLLRPWVCIRPPSTDTGCEDYLASQYYIYFTPCSRIVCIVHALYNLCCLLCSDRKGPGRGHREKLLLITTLISKIVDWGDIDFEHREKSTMIYLSFASLFGAKLNNKVATSITKII